MFFAVEMRKSQKFVHKIKSLPKSRFATVLYLFYFRELSYFYSSRDGSRAFPFRKDLLSFQFLNAKIFIIFA